MLNSCSRSWLRKNRARECPGAEVLVLLLELAPVLQVWVVHNHLGSHRGQFPHQTLEPL